MKQDAVISRDVADSIGHSSSITSAVRNAHKVMDAAGNYKYHIALHKSGRWIVNQDLIDKAAKEYERMKKELLQGIGNRLVFVGMGMSYQSRYEDDVCNHRIRTEILNPEGRKFFVELGTGLEDAMRYDFVIDRDMEEVYNGNLRRTAEEIKKNPYIPRDHPLYAAREQWSRQPYYAYRRAEARELIEGMKYTSRNVLRFVNEIFDCNFQEMSVEDYFITTDDYVSTSPKF